MAGHPFNAHREHHVEKQRVSHIAPGHKHRASGGRVHEDEKEDRKPKKMMEREHGAEGKKSKHRRDRVKRAHGGKVGHKGKGATHVNVIVGGQHAQPPVPPMMPPPPGPPPGAGAAPPAMPPGGVPGLGAPPPGMPMRAKGGSVKSGPAWKEGMKNGTPVQHSDALSVTKKNMNRGKPITFAGGGKVEAPQGVSSASKLPGGGGGGAGRKAKIGKYAVGKPMREANGAK